MSHTIPAATIPNPVDAKKAVLICPGSSTGR